MLKMFFILFVFFIGCKQENKINHQNTIAVNSNTDYNFSDYQLFELPSSLQEISGLSYSDKFIYTHNDEEGIVFKLNGSTGEVISTYIIGKDDDYEGIEIVGNHIVIAKSNGNLVFYDMKTEKSKTIKNKFKTENDVEGLGYMKESNELLIACKGEPLKGKGEKEKAIYTYNLETNELNEKPFIKVSHKELKKHVKEQYSGSNLFEKELKKLNSRVTSFAPSGIAIKPSTKEFFITSARGNLLVIFNANKQLKNIVFLNKKELPQPEGICFDEKENLFISSETKKGGGKIYKYKQEH